MSCRPHLIRVTASCPAPRWCGQRFHFQANARVGLARRYCIPAKAAGLRKVSLYRGNPGNTRLASLPLRCYGGRLSTCVELKISDKKGFYCHTVAVVYRSLTICHHFRILYSVLQGMRNAAPRVSVFIVSSKELSYSRWPRLADTSMNSFRQSMNG